MPLKTAERAKTHRAAFLSARAQNAYRAWIVPKKSKVLLENDFALFRACFYIVRILKNFYFLRAGDKKSRNAKKMLKSARF